MKKLSIIMMLVLSGCSYSIKDVNTSKAAPECVHSCINSYSQCASGGSSVGFKTETMRACKEAYEICISSCEPRK